MSAVGGSSCSSKHHGLNNSFTLPLVGSALSTRLTRRFEGSNGFAAYSPDGKRLAWFGLKEQFGVAGSTLVLRDRATGLERTMPAPDRAVINFGARMKQTIIGPWSSGSTSRTSIRS
ncbi:MAG: hypothetical protein IPJ98_20300 [Bryobacterales bacterium]|nr:hypothetical protein [Bryobacterales bacterium]